MSKNTHGKDIWKKEYNLDGTLNEDRVWDQDIGPLLANLPKNVLNIWCYAVTEMLNNAIDHSGGTMVGIAVESSFLTTNICISDNGVGIFRKIQAALNLEDERHALLELAKGKLTTDSLKHSGQGIFFTSKAVDVYEILTENISYRHSSTNRDLDDCEHIGLNEKPGWPGNVGTIFFMKLSNCSPRILRAVFDEFTTENDDGNEFDKTLIPVRLAQNGSGMLMSRSQAKRLLARIDNFRVATLDFEGVEEIGQAFADEIFRVFKNFHPEIILEPKNACEQVQKMIKRTGFRHEHSHD